MPEFFEFTFKSSTGINKIHAIKCIPDGTPKAIIQIAHGIGGNASRYKEFMEYLANNGYAVYANDHLGHGGSIVTGDEKGFFAEKNGWTHVVNDMVTLHDIASDELGSLPYVMLGHSMGSFLTRTYMIDHPDKYDYAILSGTGHQSRALVAAGRAAVEALVLAKGPHANGQMLNDMAFGSYLKKIPDARTPYDWLSRDAAHVDRYIKDPLLGFVCTASLYRDMLSGISYITNFSNIKKMNREKPVYFFSGDADPVGDYGEGVNKAYKAFCKAGLKDVFMRLYPGGRHEMLNETCKEQVYADILDWLNEKVS